MKTLVSRSSDKDGAWMVHVLRARGDVEIADLLTTITQAAERVAMHAVRVGLLQARADALGLPLWKIPIRLPCPNDTCERSVSDAVRRAVNSRFTHIAFGDLFLEDVRRYREERLAGSGLTPLFPLFGSDTAVLAREMGLGARLPCVDTRVLDRSFAGRDFGATLIADLPSAIAPRGERDEFRTFAHRGPLFAAPIDIESGPIVERDGFVFADLLAAKWADS